MTTRRLVALTKNRIPMDGLRIYLDDQKGKKSLALNAHERSEAAAFVECLRRGWYCAPSWPKGWSVTIRPMPSDGNDMFGGPTLSTALDAAIAAQARP